MKKIMCVVLSLMLALGALAACADGASVTFDDLAGLEWSFSSGAGGWSTELRFAPDGSFTGEYHDSEMGETADEYPDGTIYICAFAGQATLLEQADENAWKVRVDSLSLETEAGVESIDENTRFVTTEPYGISEGDEMLLYLPGTPVDALTEEMRMWAHLLGEDIPDALEDWFLYSEKNDSGFVGSAAEAEIANPWVEMTGDELAQTSGVTLILPEGAENVVYRWLADESLAEMQFTLEGDEYCARVKPDALEAGQLDNISGMYFAWDHEEEVTIDHCPGSIGLAQTGSEDFVELCLWYDVAPGLMYSLSVYTTSPDDLDLTAVAQMVYEPMQGDA